MHPHIYHFIYSATANVNTLIRTPSTSKSVDAQATVVDPVVSTSSIISTCFPWKQATSHNLKYRPHFPSVQKSIYGFESLYSFPVSRSSHSAESPSQKIYHGQSIHSDCILSASVFLMQRYRNNHIHMIKETTRN